MRIGKELANSLTCKCSVNSFGSAKFFCEHNSNDKLHGKGVYIQKNGHIRIGHFTNGRQTLGRFIRIQSDGVLDIGEL
jgi:hypothetical protein